MPITPPLEETPKTAFLVLSVNGGPQFVKINEKLSLGINVLGDLPNSRSLDEVEAMRARVETLENDNRLLRNELNLVLAEVRKLYYNKDSQF